MKRENGITLIALVVTIIVLLILAGVTISLVIGNNGIIGKANEADKQQCHASVKEQINLSTLDLGIEKSMEQSMLNLKEYLISKDKAEIINNVLELKITNLLGTNAKYGNGSNKSDVYTIENNTLYYYDKNGNQEKLEDLQIEEVIEEPTDESYFDFDERTGTISIKDTDSYYDGGLTTNKEAPLETYVIPAVYSGKEVKMIGHFNAPNIKKVIVLDGPTEIENNAFSDCAALKVVKLPTTMIKIDDAFRNCTALENIYLPNSITSMYSSFFDCTNLKAINIPKGVTELRYTFSNCTSLTKMILPPTLKKLDWNVFYNCTALKEIIIPSTIEEININNFYNWTSEQTIYCEAEEMPSGWYKNWNSNCDANIVWGYNK